MLRGLFAPRLGVAVSGGGDSVALLHLLHDFSDLELEVVIVDHGLRAESAEEADGVAAMAQALGLSVHVAVWRERADGGNLSDKARRARKALISDWARERGLSAVALGHTADDQAETFLMRLARGSGVQGLSGMDAAVTDDGLTWVRPLLNARRADLRAYLRGRGIGWVDDPTNEDMRFDRIKMRKAVDTLSDAGISVPDIAATTKRLRSAKQVLFTATKDLSLAISTVTAAGEIVLERERLMSAQQAVRLRCLSEAVRVVSGAYYAPRAHAIEEAMRAISEGSKGVTLQGCILRPAAGDRVAIRREPGKTGRAVGLGELWDDRWVVTGPEKDGVSIDALGESGLAQAGDWREADIAREALLTTPGVWQGDRLISAPLITKSDEYGAEWRIRNPFFTP